MFSELSLAEVSETTETVFIKNAKAPQEKKKSLCTNELQHLFMDTCFHCLNWRG